MKQHNFPNSSQVNTIRYFNDTHTLEIDFKSGKTYQYNEVPETVYEGCCAAESIGKYINEHVKKAFTYKLIPF